jgi:ADP-heptose:LPS heptosyltransferase
VSILGVLARVPFRGYKAVERIFRGDARPDAVRSVLILEYMLPLGSCVHMTPVFEAIKRDRPDIVITVATRGLGAQLLRHSPLVDHIIITPDALTDTAGATRSLRAGLKKLSLQPDCVLTGSADRRTRIAILSLLSGAGWRGGFTLLPEIYQRPLRYDDTQSLIDNNLQLARLAGCSQTHREPRVFFSPADVAAAEALVQAAKPEGKPLLVLVTQNSGGQRTGWHDERFVQVMRYADEVLGCSVLFVGTPDDAIAIDTLRQGIGTSVAGKTTVTQLAALLAMSDVVVSLDTGTMHVGRAVSVPMVVIGPSWQRPIEWLPLGIPWVRILRGEDRQDIPVGYQLDEVEAEAVITALDGLLASYPPSSESRATRVQRGLSSVDHLA